MNKVLFLLLTLIFTCHSFELEIEQSIPKSKITFKMRLVKSEKGIFYLGKTGVTWAMYHEFMKFTTVNKSKDINPQCDLLLRQTITIDTSITTKKE
jgi:hypothetical protein